MHKINRNFAVGLQMITINTMLAQIFIRLVHLAKYKKFLRKNSYTKTSIEVCRYCSLAHKNYFLSFQFVQLIIKSFYRQEL